MIDITEKLTVPEQPILYRLTSIILSIPVDLRSTLTYTKFICYSNDRSGVNIVTADKETLDEDFEMREFSPHRYWIITYTCCREYFDVIRFPSIKFKETSIINSIYHYISTNFKMCL